jgi:CP family cyanate transporter-like MFS transporter
MSRKSKFWALASVVLITTLLRPPVAAVGPILSDLQASLGISQSQAGLLASLPVLCFGFGAFAGPWLVRRFGLTHAFTIIIVVILLTLVLRVWFGFVPLLLLTVLLALAIAVSNVLFPTLIRAEFPNRIAGMTALYTALLALFASVAASASVPLLSATGDWRWALALWAIPALLALVAWYFNTRGTQPVSYTHLRAHETG